MGKKTLLSSIVIGAVVGGAVSLFNKETRQYVSELTERSADQASYYVKNPNEAIGTLKGTIRDVTETIDSNMDGAINTLDQVGSTLGKVLKK